MRSGAPGIGENDVGDTMYQWATDLFPINRSLTGAGVRATLAYLQRLVPELRHMPHNRWLIAEGIGHA